MSQSVDLNKADRKVFAASFDDGLIDILISSVTLMFAIGPITTTYLNPFLGDSWGDFLGTVMYVPLWVVVFLVLYWIRKNLVVPRMGLVKYGPFRKKKMTIFSWVMLLLNMVFLMIGTVISIIPREPGWLSVLPFSAIVLVSFTIAAYFLDLTRFYVYGLMISLVPILGEWFYREFGVPHHGFPLTFGITTLVIFLVGLIKLLTILRENPYPDEEALLQE